MLNCKEDQTPLGRFARRRATEIVTRSNMQSADRVRVRDGGLAKYAPETKTLFDPRAAVICADTMDYQVADEPDHLHDEIPTRLGSNGHGLLLKGEAWMVEYRKGKKRITGEVLCIDDVTRPIPDETFESLQENNRHIVFLRQSAVLAKNGKR